MCYFNLHSFESKLWWSTLTMSQPQFFWNCKSKTRKDFLPFWLGNGWDSVRRALRLRSEAPFQLRNEESGRTWSSVTHLHVCRTAFLQIIIWLAGGGLSWGEAVSLSLEHRKKTSLTRWAWLRQSHWSSLRHGACQGLRTELARDAPRRGLAWNCQQWRQF